ncbi:hypothetical protein PYW08_015921 [Mythimna loreyi]|uniref:Uncharacterized protein n=1 Tax=Mythimna loreyi TaxID=667449 RepID=A0ACC2QS09_9NEOP|nr:hypothetical protein PYW08_015921 [Mythimna loreyi]
MTHTNIVNGFKATGLYPYNPEAIPEEAFAPSVLSEIPCPQNQNKQVEKPDANTDTDSDENQPNFHVNPSNIRVSTPDDFDVDSGNDLNVMPRREISSEQYQNMQNYLPSTSELRETNIPRIVDYSSSTDFSETELEQAPHNSTLHDSDHSLCASPSIISENVCVVPETPTNKESYNDIDMAVPSCSGLQRPIRRNYSSDSSDIDDFINKLSHNSFKYSVEDVYGYSSTDEENENLGIINKGETTPKKQIKEAKPNDDEYCFSDEDDVPLLNLKKPNNKTEFEKFLPTPNYAVTKTNRPRKKAINYKGQRITKDLFNKKDERKKKTKKTKTKKNEKNKKDKIKNRVIKTKKKTQNKKRINEKEDDTEEWYCYACHENTKLDMRQCKLCMKWYHEECVGLSKDDEDFICSSCE